MEWFRSMLGYHPIPDEDFVKTREMRNEIRNILKTKIVSVYNKHETVSYNIVDRPTLNTLEYEIGEHCWKSLQKTLDAHPPLVCAKIAVLIFYIYRRFPDAKYCVFVNSDHPSMAANGTRYYIKVSEPV